MARMPLGKAEQRSVLGMCLFDPISSLFIDSEVNSSREIVQTDVE